MAALTTARGVRLSYLRHFINEHGGEASFLGKTTAHVCFEYVVPMTKPSELSLVDHVANDPMTASFVGPANWYVSHAWMYLFLETVDSLERFFADRDLSDDAVIWFCVFNNNQHLASSYPFEYWSSTFKNGLAAIGNVVMIMHPWNDPIVLRRSWCVFEVYVAVTLGARFEIALAHDQEATFLDDIADFDAFNKMLATIKSEDSEATVASDRDGIFELIRTETSFIAVDQLIFTTLTSWIKMTLEASIAASSSSLETAKRWKQLGTVHDCFNEYAQSEQCYQTALRTLTLQAAGMVDADTLLLEALVASAMAFQHQASWKPRFRSTLAAAIAHLGETHPTTQATRSQYVQSLVYNAVYAEALPLALDDFNVRRSQYGLFDWRTAKAMTEVGKIYSDLAEPRRAARWLRKAHTIQDAHLGTDHADTTTTKFALVMMLVQIGESAAALALATSIASSRERTHGADHPYTLACRLNLIACLLVTGDAATAIPLLLTVKTAFEAHHAQHQLLMVHLDLGVAYGIQSNWDAALAYYRRAFSDVPCKASAWLLYSFAVHTPLDDWTIVRDYVLSATDDAPETWPLSCMVCFKPIVGSVVACTACPHGVVKCCTSCYDQRPSRLQRCCPHDLHKAKRTRTVPPRRFFYEEALRVDNASINDITQRVHSYESYCSTHNVSASERMVVASMPRLNRSWHPML
ncbi:hypothetical protein SDRG_15503 [Saprolegnia diclina VS20]|uniref:Uncharacterized protein n=1 Tax=Saprolegnia diclina (strain VS20) TaxID=1156394 RepID=T0PZY2_SAPDV|nr:hypothetical protein SDRG_15503 [Saprolegnia diclina VS20]EQC26665.1 hypothetical protein SDRG_15503 [Saprolegnia diclina VS20]|eukprot:XP_008619900.1 hypothetical protein SDRG_15503 [Saprolegnia diclina VS20]